MTRPLKIIILKLLTTTDKVVVSQEMELHWKHHQNGSLLLQSGQGLLWFPWHKQS